MFKKELLTRFIGTDESEVTQYLGCELIRDRKAKTAKLVWNIVQALPDRIH
jgi:hypothetical protein